MSRRPEPVEPAAAPDLDGRHPVAMLRNESGAMMIMGVFMATLVVAMLYYVAGVGETIVYRERMQDAADSGALAGAIFLARGMNLMVLFNITLASVFTVYVTAYTTMLIIAAATAVPAARCAALLVGAGDVESCIIAACFIASGLPVMDQIDKGEEIVNDVAEATHGAQRDAAAIIPLAASGSVFQQSIESYGPPVTLGAGVLHLGFTGMPIQDDPEPPICERTSRPTSEFSLGSYGIISVNAIRAADDLIGDCDGEEYQAIGSAAVVALTLAGCEIAKDAVLNKLMRVNQGVELGAGEFQFRSLMTGAPPYGSGDDNVHDERVGVATWGRRDEARREFGALETIQPFSFAQAEFYFDGETERENWLWEFKWRGRLRRVDLLPGIPMGGMMPFIIH